MGEKQKKRVFLELEEKITTARWLKKTGCQTERKVIVEFIKETFGKSVSEKQAGNIRAHVETLLEKGEVTTAEELKKKRKRKPNVPQLEEELNKWFLIKESQGAIITDAILTSRAKEIAPQIGMQLRGDVGVTNEQEGAALVEGTKQMRSV